MSIRIVLDLSENDLKHFRSLAKKAIEKSKNVSPEEVTASAHKLLDEVKRDGVSDFIRERIEKIRILTDMLEDEGWGLDDEGCRRVLAALAYFNQPEDLIPDHLPGIGFLDDAIMIELMARELKPEIDAYCDFVKYRASEAKRLGKNPEELNRSDYLEARQQALMSRMRRRRRSGRGGGGGGKSPLAMF
ncbi:MAG: YkvA family protein [Wenzhouxiangellaceae bacterium]|nr:YkvA family protein [Wenzhouxiangellaceae bacterium]